MKRLFLNWKKFRYDLLIKVYARNNKDLLRIIHSRLQPLGLSRTETLMCFKAAFKRKLPIDFIQK